MADYSAAPAKATEARHHSAHGHQRLQSNPERSHAPERRQAPCTVERRYRRPNASRLDDQDTPIDIVATHEASSGESLGEPLQGDVSGDHRGKFGRIANSHTPLALNRRVARLSNQTMTASSHAAPVDGLRRC